MLTERLRDEALLGIESEDAGDVLIPTVTRDLLNEAARVIEELAHLAYRDHYTCEDCFYTCPQAKDQDGEWAGCNDQGKRPCDCGADAQNDKVRALIGYQKTQTAKHEEDK